MWKAVRSYLDGHAAIWSARPPFVNAVASLDDAIASADAAQQGQVVRTEGLTQDKDALEETAVEQVAALASSAKVYAMDNEDHALYASVNYAKRDLSLLPQNEMVKTMRAVVATVSRLGAALHDYGVKSSAVKAAQQTIDAYEAAQPAARVVVSERSATTDSIPAILKDGRLALTKTDGLIHTFGDPQFAAGYKAARHVVHTGIRHKKPGKPGDGTPPSGEKA